jgi:WD40 repeat protein
MAAKKTKAKPAAGGTGLGATLAVLEGLVSGTRKTATKADFAAIEGVLGDVPAELRALYGWARNVGALFAKANLEWLDPAQGAKACKMNREFETPESLFPIATDGAGNYACFDTKTGQVMDWDHETRRAARLAKDLGAYLDKTVVRELQQVERDAAKERKRAETEAATGGAHRLSRPLPVVPKKLEPLRDVLRAGAYVFVDDDEVIGVGQMTNFDHLGTHARRTADARSNAGAFDRVRNEAVLVDCGEMSLVDVKSAKLIARFAADLAHWATVVLSPDCGLACTHSTKSTIDLWDLAKRSGIPPLGSITAFTPSYDLPKGKPLATLTAHEAWVRRARFDASGGALASCDNDGTMCLWDVPKRALVFTAKVDGAATGVDFSPDGASIYVGCENGKIVGFDRAGKKRSTFKVRGQVTDLRVLSKDVLAVVLQVTVGSVYATALALVATKDGKLLAQSAPLKKVVMARISDVRGDLILVNANTPALFRVT